MEIMVSGNFNSVKFPRSKRYYLSLFPIFSICFFLRASPHFDNRAAIDLRESCLGIVYYKKGIDQVRVSQVRSKVELAIPSSIEIGYAPQGRAAGVKGKVVIQV